MNAEGKPGAALWPGAGSGAAELPRRIGRYEVRRELGRGMMGVVYEAWDPTLDRSVALKTIQITFPVSPREREAFEKRFFAEARSAAGLQHPNVVVIHDLGRDPETGTLYMALEHLAGRTLGDVTGGGARLEWHEALRITARLAHALQAAHDRGILHRDIKPANVILLSTGEPKILDFGIAKLPASQITAAGQVFGTPAHMSPEQALGDELDARSDLFSLGTVLYQLLTGRHAFEGEGVARILARVIHEDPTPPSRVEPSVPPEVDAVVARLLAKRPERRYASGRELAEDLEDLIAERAPRHLAAGAGAQAAAPRPSPPGTTAVPAPTLDIDSELHALVSEPTHDVRRAGGTSPAVRSRVLRGAALACAVAVLGAAAYLAGRAASTGAASAPQPTPGRAATATRDGTSPPFAPPITAPAQPARVHVDFDHHLKSGNLRIWVDGAVALDRWVDADRETNLLGIKLRSGRLEDDLELEPGTHDLRVRLAWDDNLRSETVTAHFTPGESRTLRVRLNRLTKGLSVEWR